MPTEMIDFSFLWRAGAFAVAVGSGAAAQEAAPPHAPNFCSESLCLEVSPVPEPAKRRFIKPAFSTGVDGAETYITISFEHAGSIRISVTPISDIRGIAGNDRILGKFCTDEGSCFFGEIDSGPELNSQAAERIKCQVRRIWIMRLGYKIDIRGDVVHSAVKIIDTRIEGDLCIGREM